MYGDKPAALARFKENYTTIVPDNVKARLVLENDEVSPSLYTLQTARLEWLTKLMSLDLL